MPPNHRRFACSLCHHALLNVLLAKRKGQTLEKLGKGCQLVDAESGTQVVADWTDAADGLTLRPLRIVEATVMVALGKRTFDPV
jgi:hypothetical protein